MNKLEYLRAVREARRIFVSTFPVSGRGAVQVRISRQKAIGLVARFANSDDIIAEWLEGADNILMVGGERGE